MRANHFVWLLLLSGIGAAHAEQYVLTTKFNAFQPALIRASLNGQTILLHRNINGNLDITPWVKEGKNTLTVEVQPGLNTNPYSKSMLTLGAGAGQKWRTLYKLAVDKSTKAGRSTFVFMAKPSASTQAGKISLSAKMNDFQPVQFAVLLNGEKVADMNNDGNIDLTPLLKSGKNLVTLNYTPGKNTNPVSQSTVTIGEQFGTTWVSLFKYAVGKADTKAGSVTFPLYR